MIRFAALLPALLLGAACASSNFEVAVDVYKETPQAERERQQDRLADVVKDVAGVKRRAPEIAAGHKLVADRLADVYGCYLGAFTDPAAARELAKEQLASRRPGYDAAVEALLRGVRAAADEAAAAVTDYLAVSFDPELEGQERRQSLFEAQSAYAEKADKLQRAVLRLNAGPGEDVAFVQGRKFLERFFEKQLKTAKFDRVRGCADEFASLQDLAAELKKKGFAIGKSVPKTFAAAADNLERGDRAGIQASVPDAVRHLTSLRGSLEVGLAAKASLGRLARAQTFYNSQVDRLQDAADPAWREILDPQNADNWVPAFTRTTFSAQGNSSVVVVRDRPGSYRVHRGENNPAALIQGQLEISRSIASGLTAVLGAVTGVQVPLLGKQATTGAAAAVTDGAQSISVQEARVDAQGRLRQAARNAVASELTLLVRELNSLPDPEDSDRARRDQIYARAAAVLSAYADLLRHSGEPR